MRVVDAASMRNLDISAVREFSMKGIQLMENAGRAVADIVLRELAAVKAADKRVAIICGKGNNGGDGFVCARHLLNAGVDVTVYTLAGLRAFKGDSGVNARCWQKMGGAVKRFINEGDFKKHSSSIRHAHVVVDALLGTGLTGGARGFYGDVIEFINTLSCPVISIDVPSGLNATTGEAAGPVVSADITVTMALPKLGFFLSPGRDLAGRVEVADIGMPAALLTNEALRCSLIDSPLVSSLLRPRSADSHKGTFGHAVVLGGSAGKTGAPYMAAMGAMRVGAGLTTIGITESLNAILELKTTEVMTRPLSEADDGSFGEGVFGEIKNLLKGKSALVAGPGLGVSRSIGDILKKLIEECSLPTVLDADALNNLAGFLDSFVNGCPSEMVLTPHPGEAARLLGVTAAKVQADRMGTASELAKRSNSVVVLKGANTIIATADGDTYINTTGGPALATAGTGDVLAGMIGGFLGQGLSAVNSAIAAVYIHGLAGEALSNRLGGTRGAVATDLLDELPLIVNSLVDE